MSVLYAPAARRDLTRLVRWSQERFGASQTLAYVAELERTIERLARSPRIGRLAGARPDVRRHVYRSHVIYYAPEGASLRIIRILHVRQDPDRHL